MAIFPQIAPNSFEEDYLMPLNSVSYSGGYDQSTAKFSRSPQIFYMTFSTLRVSQADEIKSFLTANKGLSFSFVHPINGTTHEVKYKGESLKIKWESPLYRSTSIVLQEV